MTQPQPRPAPPSFEELPAAFERGMQAADDYEFGQLANAFDWDSAPADQWVKGADMAILMGFPPLVRRLASEGMKRWPDEPRFARLWAIVRPPKVTAGTRASGTEGSRRSLAWLSQHGGEYAGNWLAIKDGRLLAAAPSIEEVREMVGPDWGPDLLIAPVFP